MYRYVFDHCIHPLIDEAFLDFSVAATFASSAEDYTVRTKDFFFLWCKYMIKVSCLFIYFPSCMSRGFGSLTALLNNIIFPQSSLWENLGGITNPPPCGAELKVIPTKIPFQQTHLLQLCRTRCSRENIFTRTHSCPPGLQRHSRATKFVVIAAIVNGYTNVHPSQKALIPLPGQSQQP